MSQGAIVPDDSPAGRTIARVRDALAHSETACVTQVLEIIQEMSDKADQLSVQDLADIIGRDLTTVAKIMRAANCLGYNPSAVDVTTLSEAINVIGFETIRNLAISLLLIEGAEKRTGAHESHDVAAVALSSAVTAQVLSRRLAGLNPEEAFVCAALRHYGRLLLSTFLAESYCEALDLAENRPLDDACNMVFGLTPLELGTRILADAHLPGIIQHTLQPVRPELVRSRNLTEHDRLLVVADFSSKLCDLLDVPDQDAPKLEAETARLLKQYSASVGLKQDELPEVLGMVGRTLDAVGRSLDFHSFASPIMNRLREANRSKVAPAAVVRAEPGEAPSEPPAAPQPFDPLALGVTEVQQLVSVRPPDARKAFGLAARAVKAALSLRSCLVFLRERGSSLYAAVVGSGAFFNEIRNQPLIDPAHRDVFTVCLARGEDVLIQNPGEPSIAPFLPDWFKRSAAAGPLVLLPVKDEDGPFALLCGIAGKGMHVDLSASRHQQLKTLRAHLARLREALETGRQAA